MQVPTGTYRVEVACLGTRPPDIACDVSSLEVVAYVQRDLNLVCRASPSGEWLLGTGTFAHRCPDRRALPLDDHLARRGRGRFRHGAARDNRFLTLNATDSIMGTWTAETELATGIATGRVNFHERRVEREFVISRR